MREKFMESIFICHCDILPPKFKQVCLMCDPYCTNSELTLYNQNHPFKYLVDAVVETFSIVKSEKLQYN